MSKHDHPKSKFITRAVEKTKSLAFVISFVVKKAHGEGCAALDKIVELQELLDKLLEDYKRLKEENEQLWSQMNEVLNKLEQVDKEKKELEKLVETYRNTMNSLVDKLQKMISLAGT
jgi:archaellum component FlaC